MQKQAASMILELQRSSRTLTLFNNLSWISFYNVSPSSERIEELWVVCGLYIEGGATLLAGAW